ncbi:MAG: hypothetical protein QOE01_3306, partial [Actinomycetota bacterium]|nr:hypothetical protein [Actinomycetota bacterium]
MPLLFESQEDVSSTGRSAATGANSSSSPAEAARAPGPWADAAGPAWQGTDFVISTRYGLPVEPRNFHRDFKARRAKAGVRPISVHSTRMQ